MIFHCTSFYFGLSRYDCRFYIEMENNKMIANMSNSVSHLYLMS